MKTQKSFFEQNGGTYTQNGDVLLPDLSIGESEQRPIGKYGRMRKRYLKEHRPVLYSNMLLSGKLFCHLAEIDQACEERLKLLIRQMAEQESVTEALKLRTMSKRVSALFDEIRFVNPCACTMVV